MRTTMIVCLLLAPAALAQDESAKLQVLHQKLLQRDQLLSAADGAATRELLRSLPAPDPSSKEHVMLLRVETLATLATGDVATAEAKLELLKLDQATDPDTFFVAHLVYAAAGDAKSGNDVLRRLSRQVDRDRRQELSRWRRGYTLVGERAPELTLALATGGRVETRAHPGLVLVISFWNSDPLPDDATQAALAALHTEAQSLGNVMLIHVNSDPEDQRAAAEAFAAEHLPGEHVFQNAARGEITDGFKTPGPPWQILIDQFGFIRAAGDVTAPAFVYATRAAALEAQQQFNPVMPVQRDGAVAQRPTDPNAGTAFGPGGSGPDTGAGQNADHPEAEKLLRQARLYLKTGKRTDARQLLEQIVSQFPDTRQAREAREIMDSLGW